MTIMARIGAAVTALLSSIPLAGAMPSDDAFVTWARAHSIALPACSSAMTGAEYPAIAKAVDGARIVALGEPVHGAHEPLAFRNCLFRYLVEKHGFTAIAIESGFNESRRLHDFASGGAGDVHVLARVGFTWGFWRYPENIELLEWIRSYNLDPKHKRKIAFYGIDVSGGDADGTWARARITLEEGVAYLARAAPDSSARLRKEIAPFLDSFSAPAYRALSGGERATLRRSISDLLSIFESDRAALMSASSTADYHWARQNLIAAQQLQTLFDVSGKPDPEGRLLPGDYRADAARDAAMASNALWALDREGPEGRILLFAHNGHIMNEHSRGGIWSVYSRPPAAMGLHLRRTLGRDLLILGTSSPAGGCAERRPTMDAALGRVSRGRFLLDIRMATRRPAHWLSQEQSMCVNSTTENLIVPQHAFDVLISLP